MKRFLIPLMLMVSSVGFCQSEDTIFHYRRSSIYSILVNHRSLAYCDEIGRAFDAMPVPDKYNDHGLGKKVFYTIEKKLKPVDVSQHAGFVVNGASDTKKMNEFDYLLQNSQVASRLVAKWFNRKKSGGTCDMQLVEQRGLQNTSEADKRMAELSVRKEALLMDAGEELIGNTFVLVNDIRYIDKSRGTSVVGGILSGISQAAQILSGQQTTDQDLGTLIASYKGFNVKIKTYLYQLVWDDDISSFFYDKVYTEHPDEAKNTNFENNRGKFSLIYLGMQESGGTTVSFAGINESEPEQMVRKVCQRVLDENVANLQKNFDVFKIKAPLISAEPLRCEIGLKEGITEKSRFELLEVVIDEKGRTQYKRKGVIRPVKGQIWDNRYMAVEEGAENATLGFTTFEKVSGSDFYPGMLVREIK